MEPMSALFRPRRIAEVAADRYRDRWRSLPPDLRTDQQLAGIGAVACGATHSVMEKCNFACTSCYLSDAANGTEPAPFEEVCEQLDELRDFLGPGGKCQITSGEVTLLEPAELGRIVAYAKRIGLDPMVMTNGQRFLQRPGYLRALVADYGLAKVSFHVDITQKGRPGWRAGMREAELHPLRDRFADLVRRTRAETGRTLHAAMTVTVTTDNAEGVAEVTRWALDNADAVRILSFLPVAPVGRTRDAQSADLTLDGLWRRVCAGVGRPLNRDALHYGHRECNITVPVVVVGSGTRRRIVEVVRAGRRWDLRVMRRTLRELGPVVDLNDSARHNVRLVLGALVRRPLALVELLAYGAYRLWGERGAVASALANLVRERGLRIRPLLLVTHRFMGAAELDTDLGRERLAACVFRVPVDGEMVSMCRVNASGIRRRLNERLARPPRVPESAAAGPYVAPSPEAAEPLPAISTAPPGR